MIALIKKTAPISQRIKHLATREFVQSSRVTIPMETKRMPVTLMKLKANGKSSHDRARLVLATREG